MREVYAPFGSALTSGNTVPGGEDALFRSLLRNITVLFCNYSRTSCTKLGEQEPENFKGTPPQRFALEANALKKYGNRFERCSVCVTFDNVPIMEKPKQSVFREAPIVCGSIMDGVHKRN